MSDENASSAPRHASSPSGALPAPKHPAGWIDRLRDLSDLIASRPPWLPALVGAATIVAVVSVWWMWNAVRVDASIEDRLPRVSAPAVELTVPMVHVHLSGRVATPGVYRLRPGERVVDLIDMAGGAISGADVDQLNLAAVVHDGDRIHVPRVGDTASPMAGGSVAGGSVVDGVVDLNRADANELERLSGIGPALAAAIIDDRTRNGPFASVDDLQRVSGIGPAVVGRLAETARAG